MKKNRNNVSQSDEVCVVLFCKNLKGTTTEGTEALRATQSKDANISLRTQSNCPSLSIEGDEIRS